MDNGLEVLESATPDRARWRGVVCDRCVPLGVTGHESSLSSHQPVGVEQSWIGSSMFQAADAVLCNLCWSSCVLVEEQACCGMLPNGDF